MTRALLIAPLLLAVLPMNVSAQSADRYKLERTESGFVRMDTLNGQMSFCEERSGQLVCKEAADERAAYVDQIDDLADRIGQLEKTVAALQGGTGAPQNALPSEQEFEQTLGFMERFMRRFMGIVKDLDSDMKSGDEPAPDKT